MIVAPHWLNPRRVAVYSAAFLLCFVAIAASLLIRFQGGVDPHGYPLGSDFIEFWGASRLALSGAAAAAYDPRALLAAQQEFLPAFPGGGPWVYPPTFLLLILPLALLPYFAAYAVFMALGFAWYVCSVRKILPLPQLTLPLIAFPAVWINLVQGQNGFLTAALICSALLLLQRRPALAGVLIGLLTVKPHLGLLLPLALVAGRHWRALATAAATSAAFLAVSLAVLGREVLPAFLSTAHWLTGAMADDRKLLSRVPSTFSFARLLGTPETVAYLLQATVAAAVAAAVIWIWSRCPDRRLHYSALTAGALLMPPYLLNYDLVWLALPLAWFTSYCLEQGWLRWEREMLAAAWLLPLAMSGLYFLVQVQVGPFVLLGLFLMIWRRALRAKGAVDALASISPFEAETPLPKG